eukprot:COSAG02_NODE_382_length_23409_cov_45.812999_11_plen_435_part_00
MRSERRGRWLLPNLAFALSQHTRAGVDSPAHLLTHELVREVLRLVGARELTHQAVLMCSGGVTDPAVQRGHLESVEGLVLAFTGSSLKRCHSIRGLPPLQRPRAFHTASATGRSVLVVGGRSATEDALAPELLHMGAQCPMAGRAPAAVGSSALAGWDELELALRDSAWCPCPTTRAQREPELEPETQQPEPEPLSAVRERACAVTLSDGRILVMGGLGAKLETLATCWLYDPADSDAAWRMAAPMTDARCDFGACLMCDGSVCVAGGVDNGFLLRSSEIYLPGADCWQTAGSLGQPRRGCSLAALPATLGGGALAIGGGSPSIGGGSAVLRTCERLCRSQHRAMWRPSLPLMVPRQHAAAVTLGSAVLVLGGFDGKRHLASAEVAQLDVLCEAPPSDRHGISTHSGQWELLSTGKLGLLVPRSQFAAVIIPEH